MPLLFHMFYLLTFWISLFPTPQCGACQLGNLFTNTGLRQIVQDKILAKDYAALLGLQAPKIIRRVKDCSDMPKVEDLPASYVFKSTHLSGCVTVVRNGKVIQAKACPMCNENIDL